MRILIFGAGGQLAGELVRELEGDEVLALSHAEADICDKAAVERHARDFRPDCLVNTAAFHRVDDCEDEVERSFAVNAVAVKTPAGVAQSLGAALVHFSTDYVFDGSQGHPYRETDVPNPHFRARSDSMFTMFTTFTHRPSRCLALTLDRSAHE